MDLSLLQTSTSEYSKQRTGANFTVRSANSPSYSLTRRLGVKKRETAEEDRHGSHTGSHLKEEDTVMGCQSRVRSRSSVTGQCEEREASRPTRLNQNGTAGRTITESGSDTRESSVLENRGRTEWRRGNLSSRSKSLDWRAGARSPDRTSRADVLSRNRVEACTTAGASKVHDRSPGSHGTLDRASRGHTLPSRWRSQSGPGSRFAETSSSFGSKGGQTILERIEKLYGSAGFGKSEDFSTPETSVDPLLSPEQRSYERSAGGTYPRRFSSGENNSQAQSRMSFMWSQKDSNTTSSDTSVSPGTSMTTERSPGRQWQGQIKARTSEEGGTNWRNGLVESGTWSLDRARSRNTIAAQIRAERAAAEKQEERKSTEVTEMWRESTRGVREHDKAKDKNELISSTDDVFETNSQITLQTAGRKKFSGVASASVRNKINQFEALTQKAQGTGTSQMPRRTFSVPTQLNKGYDGVKKSMSAKEISGLRDKWEGPKEGAETGNRAKQGVMGAGRKPGSERSLSLDEVRLRLEKKEAEGSDLSEGDNKDSSDNFGKYSRLKLEIPLNDGAQRHSRTFHVDETDMSKARDSDGRTPTSLPCGSSTPVQKKTSSEKTSPVSDNDKTPTNTPDDSPFILPAAETAENKSTSVFSQVAKSQDPDPPPPPPHPPATLSLINLPDSTHPNVNAAHPKGKKRVLDLSAWVAGLNPEFKGWDEDENDYEDDDESTQKDEDSNYDSDSGESSVTITSNMSQSDRRSFCVSLSDLCNFAGADDDSENDSDEWQPTGRRSASLSSDVSALSCVSVMPAEELDKLLEDVRSLGDDNLQDYDDVHVVVLHKEVGVGLGFSVAGGVDQNKPVTVHKVFPTGVAAQEGSIREGDQVLSINGTALCGSAHWEALRILRRAKTRDMGVVVLRRGDACCDSKKTVRGNNQRLLQTQCETGQRVCVQLQKNSRDLGFSLQGGEGSSLGNKPITVQKIFQGGPVDKVYPGDEVLEIQGMSMVGMTRLEAWTLIRKLPPGPVDVVLGRTLKHLET